jgi:hypothetical protein
LTDFIQEKFPKTPTIKLQINNKNNTKNQNDSNKKGNFIILYYIIFYIFYLIYFLSLGSIKERPANLDAIIDKKLAEKKASLAAAISVPLKKATLPGKK